MRLHTLFLLALACAGPGIARSSTRYDGDGVLNARLELERWYINRARFAPEQEADRLFLTNSAADGHPDYDVCEDIAGTNNFGSTTNHWAPWRQPKQPLAPNARLCAASTNHSKDLAETDTFQHTSPSSNYYPLGSNPWYRALCEGYTNNITGYYENIAWGASGSSAGYPSQGRPPTNVHQGLFVDDTEATRGHRQGILNANAREIGLGWFRTNSFDGLYYWTEDYDTQDFGRQSTNHFFTCTTFYDANTNGAYEEGEGVGGIQVRLWDGTNQAAWYDESQPSGNFAIPINDLADGHDIDVQLVNTSASAARLTIPFGYRTLGEIELSNQESYVLGSFTQPFGTTNAGFRNIRPRTVSTLITAAGTNMAISFSAFKRVQYQVESSETLPATNWILFDTQTATGDVCQSTDTGQAGRPAPGEATQRFYRIQMLTE